MAFNPIPAPDPKTWELTIEGLDARAAAAESSRPRSIAAGHAEQSSEMRAVLVRTRQLGRLPPQELLKLARSKSEPKWVRVDCADKYYDFVKIDDLLHPRTLFGLGMNGEALTPEHGAPLRLVMPAKYGYKSSKLITRLTFVDQGGMGLVADGWPYYSASGDILPGVDHPFEFPDEVRKIKGGEIVEY